MHSTGMVVDVMLCYEKAIKKKMREKCPFSKMSPTSENFLKNPLTMPISVLLLYCYYVFTLIYYYEFNLFDTAIFSVH